MFVNSSNYGKTDFGSRTIKTRFRGRLRLLDVHLSNEIHGLIIKTIRLPGFWGFGVRRIGVDEAMVGRQRQRP